MNDEQLVASSDDEVTCEQVQPLEDENCNNAVDTSESVDVRTFINFFLLL